MTPVDNISDHDAKEPPLNAVSLYGQDGVEDFPVLKAFQCYIDAEQAKSRKRMLSLCVFFGCLMTVVVSVFVVLLMRISDRNQQLNDRMVEFAMNLDRSSKTSPVVVQPPQDSAAILALTSKLDSLQKKLADDQAKAEKAAAEAAAKAEQAAIDAARPKPPSADELEIKRLKALLAAEKERTAAEKERLKQAEIEAYRRKHYPELYETPKTPQRRTSLKRIELEDEEDDVSADLIDENHAVRYFDEEEEEPVRPKKKPVVRQPAPKVTPELAPKKEYSIPVDVKESSINWKLPEE